MTVTDEAVYPRLERGIPNDVYQAMNDLSSRSYLVRCDRGGGEVQERMDLGFSQFSGNSATSLGSKFDRTVEMLILGKTDVIVTPPAEVLDKAGRRSGNAYKQWAAEVAREGKVECNEEDAFKLRTMLDSLMGCPPARKLVEATDEVQLSAFFLWDGHPCRVRPDGVTPDCWWDLKSTSSTWDRLHFSVWDYGYAEQEAMYVEAAMQLGWPHHRMPFVFVQTMEPFGCRVKYLPEDMVAHAKARLINTLQEVALRRKTGIYKPAECEEITELEVPSWSLRKQETEVFVG